MQAWEISAGQSETIDKMGETLAELRKQIEALVFHALAHAGQDPESGQLIVRNHSFEGFVEEVEVYGMWSAELEIAGAAFRQLPLDLDEEA